MATKLEVGKTVTALLTRCDGIIDRVRVEVLNSKTVRGYVTYDLKDLSTGIVYRNWRSNEFVFDK